MWARCRDRPDWARLQLPLAFVINHRVQEGMGSTYWSTRKLGLEWVRQIWAIAPAGKSWNGFRPVRLVQISTSAQEDPWLEVGLIGKVGELPC